MRIYVLAILAAALFVPPTPAFSQVDVEVGPGGVYVGPRHRHYDDGYHQGDRYGGARCRELPPGLSPQGRARRTRDGQLPQISRTLPIVSASRRCERGGAGHR